jgi:hypothetical protein
VTFTFDATRRIVWLDELSDGNARAGDLCTRHADALVPPQGWTREDRRVPVAATVPTRAGLTTPAAPSTSVAAAGAETDELLPHREPKRRRRRAERWSDVPSLFDSVAATVSAPAPVVLELVDPEPTDPAPVESAPSDPSPGPVTAEVDIAAEPGDASGVGSEPDAPVEPAWKPRFDVDDLGGLLDAKSPLLSRAFRAAKTADIADDPAADDASADADQTWP